MTFAATATNIQCITGTTKTASDLSPFVAAANAKIKRVATCDPTLTDDELSSIADWYASYLFAAGGSDNKLNRTKIKLEQFETTFGGQSEHAATRYWNTANDLSGGCLATLDKQVAQIAVL